SPPPPIDQQPSRAVLRDGTVVTIRPTTRDDAAALGRFFHELSSESRRRRFFSLAEPDAALLERFSDSSDPRRQTTLLALRLVDGDLQPIAVGSYIDLGKGVAEAAFAVADAFQGKGLGTVLLERLAGLAAANGIRQFEASVLPENTALIDVFTESGFQ